MLLNWAVKKNGRGFMTVLYTSANLEHSDCLASEHTQQFVHRLSVTQKRQKTCGNALAMWYIMQNNDKPNLYLCVKSCNIFTILSESQHKINIDPVYFLSCWFDLFLADIIKPSMGVMHYKLVSLLYKQRDGVQWNWMERCICCIGTLSPMHHC